VPFGKQVGVLRSRTSVSTVRRKAAPRRRLLGRPRFLETAITKAWRRRNTWRRPMPKQRRRRGDGEPRIRQLHQNA